MAYERELIEDDRHPIFIEALLGCQAANDLKKVHAAHQRSARLKEKDMAQQAEERQLWLHWQEEKRLLYLEMLKGIVHKQKKLDLEVTVENDYSKCALAKE